MTIRPLTFGMQSKPGDWGLDGSNRLINAYAENMGEEGRVPFPIRCSPGLIQLSQAPNQGGIRGMLQVNNILYIIAGSALWRADVSGTFFPDAIGGVPGTELVAGAINQRKPNPEIAIVSEGSRFILLTDPTDPILTPITDPDLPPPIDVTYVDGYFLYAVEDGQVFVSGINDGATIDPLAFFTAEGSPDGLVGIRARSREVFLFGDLSIEVWANDGSNNPAPFSRSLGEFIQVGCGSRQSITAFNQSLAFVDNENFVRWLDGYAPRIISEPWISKLIEDLEDPSEITGLSYEAAGQQFLQFSSSKWTVEYNGRTGLWNERESFRKDRYCASWATLFNGRQIFGDCENGKLYQIDRKTYNDAGEPLIWTLRAPVQQNWPGRLEFNQFYVDLVPGVGLNSTDPALNDPEVMVRYADDFVDGTPVFGNVRHLKLGKLGTGQKRISTNRLGQCGPQGRVWEISMSAAVGRSCMGAAVDLEQLPP